MPDLIDATDLDQWAPRRDAQGRLPQLMRRLIVESSSTIRRLDFPAGEGVQRPGWDGIADVSGAERFVPEGLSLWELGTGGDPRRKAEEEDYQKRTRNPLGFKPATATYVAVTARRWSKKREWVEAKADSPWKEVRAFDADDLALWLEDCPATHLWLAELLGRHPQDARALTTWWESWAAATRPPISHELVLAGRESEGETFVSRVGSPGVVTLTADSPDEAVAFVAAALRADGQLDSEQLLTRATVVHTAAGWTRAVASQRPGVLIPMFPEADVGSAVAAGHRVVIPAYRHTSGDGETLDLGRVRRSAARDVLRAMGVPETDVDQAALVARRSLMSLRRRLGVAPHLATPPWSAPEEATALVPALMAGVWDDTSEGDRQAVSRLAGGSYADVVRALTRWANEPDPPVRRVGSTWMLVSKEDAWRQLSRYLATEDLEHLQQVVCDVLAAPDPRLDLPESERWMAAVRGVVPRHSGLLREGLADTIALIAARSGTQQLAVGQSGQEFANVLVRDLLRSANDDETGKLWVSLSDVLPLLGEAAPDIFLEALDTGTSGDVPVVMKMFTDSQTTDPLFSSAAHSNLLWGLETVAWSPRYLGRAALLLARLARLDPGGTWANRPRNSLREVFLPWHPQTAATVEERIEVLDMLLDREREVAVTLFAGLLPHAYDSATPNHPPRWRGWRIEPPDPPEGWAETVAHVTRRLIALAKSDPEVWLQLVDGIANLPTQLQDEILSSLMGIDRNSLGDEVGARVAEAIRAEAARHRRFADAKWAMPGEQVARLEAVYHQIAPDDVVATSAWLFGHHPDLPEQHSDDWDAYRQTLADVRHDAVSAVLEAGGLEAVADLARCVQLPFEVGHALDPSAVQADEDTLFGWMDAGNEALRQVARGYVVASFASRGWQWADETLEQHHGRWSHTQQAEFLFGLPMTGETWDRAERLGDDTVAAYWSSFSRVILPDPAEHERAARALVEHGRLFAAVDLLGHYVGRLPTPMNPTLIAEVLKAAATTPSDDTPDGTMLRYNVARLLDVIELSGQVEDRGLAHLEWLYLPLLHSGDRQPRLLHRELAQDAAFFVEVVTWRFRAEGETREVTEDSQARAQAAFYLLESWKGLPGFLEDGSVDEAALRGWVMAARTSLHDSGRPAIGDQRIGHVLRYSPHGTDGAWPHEAVRSIIEEFGSEHIETGIEIQVYNSRGVTSRGVYEGGDRERTLAQRYREWADSTQARWPRTAALLRRIAESYERDGRRHDTDAERDEDL